MTKGIEWSRLKKLEETFTKLGMTEERKRAIDEFATWLFYAATQAVDVAPPYRPPFTDKELLARRLVHEWINVGKNLPYVPPLSPQQEAVLWEGMPEPLRDQLENAYSEDARWDLGWAFHP